MGFAMYYFTYDPWIGKLLYLEDFYVMAEYRGMCSGIRQVASHGASLKLKLTVVFVLLGLGIGSEILKNLSQVCGSDKPKGAEWWMRDSGGAVLLLAACQLSLSATH